MRPHLDSLIRLAIAILAALALAWPAALLAQPHTVGDDAVRAVRPRLHFGIGLQGMQAVGAFADSVDGGFGVGFHARYELDRQRIFALRADVGYNIYGSEEKRIAFPNAPRVTLEQSTDNTILSYSVGPQLMWPSGAVRPYALGTIGGSYFATNTSLEGTNNDDQPFASSENFSDNAFSYGGGAGVLIPFRTRRTPVSLDIGARYVHNGTARYLKPGSIQDTDTGYIVTPIEGPANFVVYTLGITVGAVRDDRERW